MHINENASLHTGSTRLKGMNSVSSNSERVAFLLPVFLPLYSSTSVLVCFCPVGGSIRLRGIFRRTWHFLRCRLACSFFILSFSHMCRGTFAMERELADEQIILFSYDGGVAAKNKIHQASRMRAMCANAAQPNTRCHTLSRSGTFPVNRAQIEAIQVQLAWLHYFALSEWLQFSFS